MYICLVVFISKTFLNHTEHRAVYLRHPGSLLATAIDVFRENEVRLEYDCSCSRSLMCCV